MLFSCYRAELNAAVQTALRAVSAKSSMTVLEGLLLEAFPSSIRLTGFDLKRAIHTTIDAQVREQGSIVLNAKIFAGIVSSLPEGEVTVRSEGLNTWISCGKSEFFIIGMEAAEYPELPEADGNEGVSLPRDILAKMIRQTIFAVSDNESRPVYTGELFELMEGVLTLVAVDGYRLSLRRERVEGVEADCKFIVPGDSLSDLEKLCGEGSEPVNIRLGNKHISFSLDRTVLISRRLDGEFMNYHTTVPTSFAHSVIAERTQLQSCVQRVSLIIDDRIKYPLRCTFEDDLIHIVCVTPVGKAEDYCPVDGNARDLEIGFNNRFLLDVLRNAPADELRISLNTGSSPCVITPADDNDSFLYMILPVRLRAEL